ncbi:hypothetical protein CULT_2170003 [[Clostridium] ultunense Esp]|uniref:Uncharacterized protein n=1 Tax=[Clostridium] ultunense Esp TaxID=1288971 RepID=M1ZAK3_9FIRM|nr:hypothetical protein [Schnuerera ultunensis]CCQ94949.1 hypothetical protein CULT_2170003 [[Clostridium] ultunense Esp]SHD76578.1 conserved protein of unknown function [[Clostridium] ultunense Esp]
MLDDQVSLIEIGKGEEIIGILAHVDVVLSGDIDAWVVPSFKAVESLGKPFKKKIQLIIGTQEEVEWTDMKAYVKKFSVCNIEKAMTNIEISVLVDTKLEVGFII